MSLLSEILLPSIMESRLGREPSTQAQLRSCMVDTVDMHVSMVDSRALVRAGMDLGRGGDAVAWQPHGRPVRLLAVWH